MIHNRIVEIWRSPLIDDSYGPRRDWDNSFLVASIPASVQPLSSDESLYSGGAVETRIKVYLKSVTVIEVSDRALIEGTWYEVDGDPALWDMGRSSMVRHTKLILRRYATSG